MSSNTAKQLLFTQVILFCLLLWAGMVAGISFLEAPIKFTAPKVTLAIGLGIGRLVFGWLNKFEMLFCGLVLAGLRFNHAPLRLWRPALLLTIILLSQTLWLLPVMDARALLIISGQQHGPSSLHWVYVGLDFLKLMLLLFTASAVLRHQFAGLGLQQAA